MSLFSYASSIIVLTANLCNTPCAGSATLAWQPPTRLPLPVCPLARLPVTILSCGIYQTLISHTAPILLRLGNPRRRQRRRFYVRSRSDLRGIGLRRPHHRRPGPVQDHGSRALHRRFPHSGHYDGGGRPPPRQVRRASDAGGGGHTIRLCRHRYEPSTARLPPLPWLRCVANAWTRLPFPYLHNPGRHLVHTQARKGHRRLSSGHGRQPGRLPSAHLSAHQQLRLEERLGCAWLHHLGGGDIALPAAGATQPRGGRPSPRRRFRRCYRPRRRWRQQQNPAHRDQFPSQRSDGNQVVLAAGVRRVVSVLDQHRAGLPPRLGDEQQRSRRRSGRIHTERDSAACYSGRIHRRISCRPFAKPIPAGGRTGPIVSGHAIDLWSYLKPGRGSYTGECWVWPADCS